MPNPTRALERWAPAVVGGVFQTGLNLMRDLERKGVRVAGVDCNPEHQGFRSRWGKSHLCPNPDTQPAEWLAFMKSLALSMGAKPVFIPAADQYVSALGDHADALAEFYIFSRKGVELQAALSTKEQQYALAEQAGFPCPRSAYIRNREELRQFASTAQFPCLIKPLAARAWDASPLSGKKIVTADNAEALLNLYSQVEPHCAEAVAQEMIEGPDSAKYCYLSVYASGGKLLGNCVVQELRNHPIHHGMASVVRPVMDPEITAMCDGFLRSIGYVGICEMEVKRDVRDGKVRLIEVNPRFSGTGDSASYTGIETGWLHYLDLIGQEPYPVEVTRLGFHHIAMQLECMTAPKYLEAKEITWREIFAPYKGPVEFYDLNRHDWKLSLRHLRLSAKSLVGGLLRTAGIRR